MFDQRVLPAYEPSSTPDDKRHGRKFERSRWEKVCKNMARKERPKGDKLLELYAKHNREWIAEEYGVEVWQVSQWVREARGW